MSGVCGMRAWYKGMNRHSYGWLLFGDRMVD